MRALIVLCVVAGLVALGAPAAEARPGICNTGQSTGAYNCVRCEMTDSTCLLCDIGTDYCVIAMP